MPVLLAALITIGIFATLYRGQLRKPAAALGDGSGHMLQHGRWERVIAWVVLISALVPAGLAAYVLCRPAVARFASRTVVELLTCSGLFAALAVWSFQSLRRHICVNDIGVTLCLGRRAIEITWSNVTRVTTDLSGALLICGPSGAEIQVNKLLVGIPTLVSYMRRHLPESMYSGAFCTYTPRAHLGG
ncbi:MAG TPA: hypothetical protein VMF64_04620 [Steroidobacteraceae bacterium]|nr:hypothetical protein [Steroidobacteraceae bacterium]